jgi:Zn-dependent protease with chaperone function
VRNFKNREQKRLRTIGTVLAAAILLAPGGWAELKQLRPGWNLFSPQQDVQIGKEAASQMERKLPVVHNRDLDNYLNVILRKLEKSSYARTLVREGERGEMFPFQIRAVYDKNINAFSLPGGPIFVNTAVIQSAENEAQLAGVIAHEMSHVVLRHSTNQASKRNLVALPAVLASALVGNSLLGQLTQVGISFTANSALLKFSRTDEAEADYNGAEIMADAGYNPLELARFFEILEAKSGRQGTLVQFLSDHPNPGNRVSALNDELRQMPRRAYVEEETGQFARVQELVRHLQPPEASRRSDEEEGPVAPSARSRPSGQLRSYAGQSFTLTYPENWQVYVGQRANSVTIAPREGLVKGPSGQASVGYGIEANYYTSPGHRTELERDTQALIAQFQQSNTGMHIGRAARSIEVARQPALLSTLYSKSPFGGGQEVDALVTVVRPEGLFYIVFIAPQDEFDAVQVTFEEILRSVQFK